MDEKAVLTLGSTLGCRYRDGDGVEKNIGTAIDWMQKAAAQNSPGAQEALDELKKEPATSSVTPPVSAPKAKTAEVTTPLPKGRGF